MALGQRRIEMSGAGVPEGWERDSETLYLHESGVRIERRLYRSKEGWVLVPVDLDRKVLEFPPDDGGLERAFAAFADGAFAPIKAAGTRKVQEARDGARRDEKPDEPPEDEEDEDDEAKDEKDGGDPP